MIERRTITKLFAERYQRATKKEKGELLKEYLKLTDYDRCYCTPNAKKPVRRM